MTVLVADIGGTHARFAIADPDAPSAEAIKPDVMMVAGVATLEEALSQYLETKDTSAAELAGAVFCAAGPVRGDGSIQMTNCPWVVDPKIISSAQAFPKIHIMNDMSAAALGLLRFKGSDTQQIGEGTPDTAAPKAIIAPGTGLGVSGLIPSASGSWAPLSGEGGHVDLAPSTEREIAVVFHLLRQHGHASAERLLSGPGLETLHITLAALDGVDLKGRPAAVDIANAARRGETLAQETVRLFCGWLGSVAGDLVLTLGAKGGLYVGGGIVPQWGEQWGDLFDEDLFRRRFMAKGRFSDYLAPVPTYLVKQPDLALLGCLEQASRLLA